tara:strand:+ start:1239 stop:1454 length:216 start_codon:yes stop_codon:yes gene_type:complete
VPRYEYLCECGFTFERTQSFNEPKLKKCPKDIPHRCKGNGKVQRLMGTPMIISDDPGRMTDKKLYKELDID